MTHLACPPRTSVTGAAALVAACVGLDARVPLLDGTLVRYVNLDNAASTPALRAVAATIDEFLPYYSAVHRGTGYKSRLSTAVYERARELVGAFVGADPDRDVVVFTKNTTEAINKLAHAMPIEPGSIVLTTLLEHHSNDLPWRAQARTLHVGVRCDGSLDLDDLDRLLRAHAGRVALLAVSGASNVTGVVQPVHELAEKVHAIGGRILVDAAQLAPHRPIDMRPHDDPGHLDAVVVSAHKMYAPYGTGALITARGGFRPEPDHRGGGTVRAVTPDTVAWAPVPDREEAGSPNVLGAVALAAAICELTAIGLERIAAHERRLTRYALDRLAGIPGVEVHGPSTSAGVHGADTDALGVDRLGVIPLTVSGTEHALVAAVLGYEHGIGVRSGCFCAQPYVVELLGLDRAGAREWVGRVSRGDKRGAPGFVRISLGLYNTCDDIDRVVAALERIADGDIAGDYRAETDGSYHPVGYAEPQLFTLDA